MFRPKSHIRLLDFLIGGIDGWLLDHVQVGDPALVYAVLREFVNLLVELRIGCRRVDRRTHWRVARQWCRYPVERVALVVDRQDSKGFFARPYDSDGHLVLPVVQRRCGRSDQSGKVCDRCLDGAALNFPSFEVAALAIPVSADSRRQSDRPVVVHAGPGFSPTGAFATGRVRRDPASQSGPRVEAVDAL
jgi:hypothetical protein